MYNIYFHLIIEEYDKVNDKHIDLKDIDYLCRSLPNIRYYSYILHDKDVDKRKHYHVNIAFGNNGYAKQNVISKVASILEINMDCIGCKESSNSGFYSYNRYLIHIDNEEKHQYQLNEVYTNDIKIFSDCISGINPFDLGIETIVFYVKTSETKKELFSKLGLKFCNTYYKVINDLRNMKGLL